MVLSLTVASSSSALGPIRAQFRRHLVAEVSPGSGNQSPSLMQTRTRTANTASLLVKSSLASVGTVQLASPAQYCDATCIRCLTPSGTVGSSITLALSSMQRCEELLWLQFTAFAYSLVVATWFSSILIVI